MYKGFGLVLRTVVGEGEAGKFINIHKFLAT